MPGGGDYPEQESSMEQAQSQLWLANEQARIAEEARQRQLAEQRAEQERLLQEFNANLATAKQGATNYATGRLTERGLNPDTYLPRINEEINRVALGVPIRDPNPGAYFSGDITDLVLNRIRDQERLGYRNQLDPVLGTNAVTGKWADTADDSIIEAILGDQYATALDTVTRSRDRGILTGGGFDSALAQLNNQRTASNARLQDLGGSVLGGYRSALSGIADEAYRGASSYELGQTYNPQGYIDRFNNMFTDQQGRLEGDLRNALGGESLFNTENLITRAGVEQGLTSGSVRGLADAFAERETERQRRRGLDSEGVF